MADSAFCCGFGGSFSIEHPRVARRLLRRKLDNARESGAALLVADNPGCLMHLAGGIDAQRLPLRAKHLVELLAARLPS
jgi:Fe-S oxidoreductase